MQRPYRVTNIGRRVAAVASVAVAMSVAACSDASTAPTAPVGAASVDRPSEVILKVAAFLTVRVADTTGKTLNETGWVQFSTTPTDTMSVYDNSAKDLDPAVGVIKVGMTKSASYKACLSMTQHYRGDLVSQVYPRCKTVTSFAFNVDMGTVYGQRSPQIILITKNEFNTLVGGASFNVSVPGDNWNLTMADGQWPYDESVGANGTLTYTISWPNVIKYCEVSPPPKMDLTSAKCGTFDAKWGTTKTVVFDHEAKLY